MDIFNISLMYNEDQFVDVEEYGEGTEHRLGVVEETFMCRCNNIGGCDCW